MATTNINVGKGLTPSIELLGNWGRVTKLLNGELQSAVLLGTRQGQISSANKIVKLAKKNIRRNGPPGTYWPRYSIGYEKAKARMGGNIDKKYRLTNTYYSNIRVIDKGAMIMAGLPSNVRGKANPKRKKTLIEIAHILEYGRASKNIAGRPLWRPTFREFGGKARVASHILFHIRVNVLALGAIKSNQFKIRI